MKFELCAMWQHVEPFLFPYPPLAYTAAGAGGSLYLASLKCSNGFRKFVARGQHPWEVNADCYEEWKQQAIQVNKTYCHESLSQHPYEVSIGTPDFPDYYAEWKQSAIRVHSTYSCLSKGKWIPDKWWKERCLASSARAQACVIYGFRK